MNLDDIKKLANLARIEMSDEEMIEIGKDFNPILSYVGQVREALNKSGDVPETKESKDCAIYNITRDDIVSNKKSEYTKEILEDAPEVQDGYIKVKQIL